MEPQTKCKVAALRVFSSLNLQIGDVNCSLLQNSPPHHGSTRYRQFTGSGNGPVVADNAKHVVLNLKDHRIIGIPGELRSPLSL